MKPVLFPDKFPRTISWEPLVKFNHSQVLPLAKTSRTIKPVELSALIKTKIVAEKTNLQIGEQTELNLFFGKTGESISNQVSVSLFDKDYEVTLKDVTWFSNGKQLSQTGPNISFVASKIGNNAITASPTFTFEPQEGKEYGGEQTLNSSLQNILVEPRLEMYANGVPLENAKLYLGQRVRLEPKFFGDQDQDFPLSEYEWQIEEPAVYGMEIGANQVTGEAVPAKQKKGEPAEFLLYSYDRNVRSKKVLLRYQIQGVFREKTINIPFFGPNVEGFLIYQTVPELWPREDTWRLGYKLLETDKVHAGSVIAHNDSDISFSFFVVQLVKDSSERTFDSYSQIVDMPEMQLDGGFPYLFPFEIRTIEVAPGDSTEKDALFDDSPVRPLQEDANLQNPKDYFAKSKFAVFVLAKADVVEGQMVPLLFYEWEWQLNAIKTTGSQGYLPASEVPKTLIDKEKAPEVPLDKLQEKYPNFLFGFPHWKKKLPLGGLLPWKNK